MIVYLHPLLPSLLFIKFIRGPFSLDLFLLLLTKSYELWDFNLLQIFTLIAWILPSNVDG